MEVTMKRMVTVSVLGLLSLSIPPVLAEETAKADGPIKYAGFTLSGNLVAVSDYVSRGTTASRHRPAVQSTLNANHDTGFYLSLFASNVDLQDGENTALELDPTIGFAKEWENGFSVDVGVLQYLYPASAGRLDYDYREYFLGAGVKILDAILKAKYSYSDDYTGVGDFSASYLDTQISYNLPYKITLKGHYGRAFGDVIEAANTRGISGYNDYSVGLATELVGLGLELTYISMDKDGRSMNPLTEADQRVTLGISKAF